ncbi:MAG: metal-dependent transcriptional regulator [Deltaproteobacteria bacterium]|nr:metal-dependent transcriptional regulator [Deltaproteobacteria bacterium]
MTQSRKNDIPDKPLTSVMEDYLEAIAILDEERKVVRVKDIAKKLGVKMPSVTSMLKTLSLRGLINYQKYEYVELTKKGADIGKNMRRKHRVIRAFLTDFLRVDFETADDEACQMEHALSSSTLDSLTDFMEFIQTCPRAGQTWLDYFAEYQRTGRRQEHCTECVELFSCGLNRRLDS